MTPAAAAAQYQLPEPPVTAAQLFRLPAAPKRCTKRTVLPVSVVAIPGLRLNGVTIGAGRFSATVGGSTFSTFRIPLDKGRTVTLRITAVTAAGRPITLARRYRACRSAKKRRKPAAQAPREDGSGIVISEGGGED